MKVFANLAIFSSDIAKEKRYILSTDPEQMVLPRMEITDDNKSSLFQHLGVFVREHYLMANDFELLPKMIELHSNFISTEKGKVEMVYASVVDHQVQKSEKNCHWLEFDALDNLEKEKGAFLLNCIRNL